MRKNVEQLSVDRHRSKQFRRVNFILYESFGKLNTVRHPASENGVK